MGKNRIIEDFRTDINGIRAISVLIVVLFHLGMKDWSGGFVGVDIFFVISGYLIVPRIYTQFLSGDFSTVSFLKKRIRRLVPALIPVLLFSLFSGSLIFGDAALEELLNSILAASGFMSNYLFIATRGYFERTTDLMLLLHTWSLGVEFQFYLLMPFALLVFRRYFVQGLVALFLFSFVASVFLAERGSNFAYYGISSRFWQLAIGGLIGIAQPRINQIIAPKFAWVLRLAGIAMVVYAALTFTTQTPFPGMHALLPTIGAALVVGAPTLQRDFVFRTLSSPPLQWLGLRSYSIYLWHWPLILTANSGFGNSSEGKGILAVLAALFLAEISYRFIEMPVQSGSYWKSSRKTYVLLTLPFLVFGSVVLAERAFEAVSKTRDFMPFEIIRLKNGFADPARHAYMDKLAQTGTNGETGLCSLDQLKTVSRAATCLENSPQKARTLFIGDSHGRDYFWAFKSKFLNHGVHMLYQSACAPARYEKCFPDLAEHLPKILKKGNYSKVVLASHWPEESFSALEDSLQVLIEHDVELLVIGAGPVFEHPVTQLIFDGSSSQAKLEPRISTSPNFRFDVNASNDRLLKLKEAFPFILVNRLELLCPNAKCYLFVPGQRKLMYFDNQHLTLAAMEWIVKIMGKEDGVAKFFD